MWYAILCWVWSWWKEYFPFCLFLFWVSETNVKRRLLTHVRLWFFSPIGRPSAWWWLSWRGSRTSWCLRTSQPSTLRTLLARPRPRRIGIASQSWNLGRFLWPIVETATFWWAIPWTFGTCGFLSTRRYPGGICAASWRHQSPARICARPWSRVAFSGPCRRWIYEQFVWYEPLFWIRMKISSQRFFGKPEKQAR